MSAAAVPAPAARVHDLRLFGVALGMWAAGLVALRIAATVAWSLAGGAASLAVLVLVVVRRRRSAARHRASPSGWGEAVAVGVVGVLIGSVCGLASTAARTASRDADPLATLARDRTAVDVELTVTDDPHPLAGAGPGPPTYLIPATLSRVTAVGAAGRVDLDARVVVFATDVGWRGLLPSQRVATAGTLGVARGGDLTAAVLTATGAPAPLNRPSWTQLAAGRLRAGLQAACLTLPAAAGGLLPGLVIGDTSRLDPALEEQFRITGLTHLIAVSGANVSIVLGVVLFAARWCRAGPWLCAGICALGLVGFVILARPSPSVIRAAAMGAIGLVALATGRSRSATPALAAAVILGLLVDPALAVDAGFALSVIATGALVLLAPGWRDALVARGVPGVVAEAFAVPAAAQVACGPVIVALSGQVSLVAIPANLLAAPAVAPATLLGVGSAVISPLWSDGARGLAWLASWPAGFLVAVARIGAGIPDAAVPWPAGGWGALTLTAVTGGVFVLARRPGPRRLLLAGALAIAVGAAPVRWSAPGWPPGGAVVVACDVGQGDALVLPDGPGEAVVIDAGPDPSAVDGCLHRLGVRTVGVLLFTHFHADHVGGAAGVLTGRAVGGLVLPSYDEPAAGSRLVLAVAGARAVPVIRAGVGWTYHRGPLELRVLGPARSLTGTRSDPNNNSLVVRAVSHGVSILLTGDAETEEQSDLLAGADPADLRAEVLKVAHHGSPYQDPDLLDAVHPSVALVSVGVDNPYGHPNPALLDRLTRAGVRVLRTDRDGDLAVVVQVPGRLGVVVRGPPPMAGGARGRAVRPPTGYG